MSNIVTNLCRPIRLQPVRKCVLMALADRADDHGIAWPSLAWLCEWTCFSRRAVMNALEDLAQAGIVQVNKVAGKNSRCEIDLEKLREEALNPGTTCTTTQAPHAQVDNPESELNPGTTCTSAGGAPVHDVHHHPGTTCTTTQAPHAPGGARRAPDTSIDTINTSIKTSISCTESQRGLDAFASPTVVSIPLNDGTEHPVSEADIAEWRQAFPGVDVSAALLRARLWCKDNPTRRKTKRGVRAFLTGWLGRDQDKGGRVRLERAVHHNDQPVRHREVVL
ncbi:MULTISPECIES: helix-turn-helix domain-containing protein [Comamonas]|uniref:Helix-turn-helix domain-containing protein n=1 Tax=Comamonas squillarum TaxID=2977320 RepID=A0ABY5ZXB4_9BURK|nr:helix-turn-helix domain-containing protein [Comamonas sp. PR12]UXC18538.1 helix-turn-helix domain-containing protein [Comamonas sp. PR12]